LTGTYCFFGLKLKEEALGATMFLQRVFAFLERDVLVEEHPKLFG
jgi:hypothetical protein